MAYDFIHSKQLVLEPKPGSPWAGQMVLNPAIIEDPDSGRLHMLFRATGPWPQKQLPGKPLPYPIFLGYAYSEDRGATWTADFTRPALAPGLEYDIDKIYITNREGQKVVNYANGCVEDPRLFRLEDKHYVIVACRLLPPGPYWLKDDPTQCAPAWINTPENPFGRAASENVTGNVLYEVNLEHLARGNYAEAFQYVTPLTNPEFGENRDVMLFPEKMRINGREQFICLHRPFAPAAYLGCRDTLPPSILLCASETLEGMWRELDTQTLLASPRFSWEHNRIGASAPPLRISEREWLLCYHGKQDNVVGYTQSFMILEEQTEALPRIKHRCPERLMVADQPWEMPVKFKIPCVFITGLIPLGQTLLASYGAADEKAGIARIELPALVEFVRKFDAEGK